MMPSRCCIKYVSKSERPSSGHRTGKGQSSFQFLRKAVLKNVQSTRKFHPKMGSIKNRNSEDLIEAEEIKKRWTEYMEEWYKK